MQQDRQNRTAGVPPEEVEGEFTVWDCFLSASIISYNRRSLTHPLHFPRGNHGYQWEGDYLCHPTQRLHLNAHTINTALQKRAPCNWNKKFAYAPGIAVRSLASNSVGFLCALDPALCIVLRYITVAALTRLVISMRR